MPRDTIFDIHKVKTALSGTGQGGFVVSVNVAKMQTSLLRRRLIGSKHRNLLEFLIQQVEIVQNAAFYRTAGEQLDA